MRRTGSLTLFLLAALTPCVSAADKPPVRTARAALQPFNDLIGSWRALGTPEGTLPEKQKGLWEETIRWEWQFKGDDAWLKVSFDKSKYFTDGTLRHLPDSDQYQLSLTTTAREMVVFTGPLKEHKLLLERRDEKTKETQRLVLSLVGDNRYLYQLEVRPEDRQVSRKVYLVGATKEGSPLVKESGEIGPLCVVSYGPAISPVSYKGKTYYVCCGGCRDAFRAEPEKFIKEYEEKLAALAGERAEKSKKP